MERVAVIPSMMGMVMSISTRSGRQAAYFSTASCPFDRLAGDLVAVGGQECFQCDAHEQRVISNQYSFSA